MSDTELIQWARRYFNGIPDKARLPSDRRLAMQTAMYSTLTEEQREELTWIRTIVEGDITVGLFGRKKKKKEEADDGTR